MVNKGIQTVFTCFQTANWIFVFAVLFRYSAMEIRLDTSVTLMACKCSCWFEQMQEQPFIQIKMFITLNILLGVNRPLQLKTNGRCVYSSKSMHISWI